jgi:hypothetical protein
LITTGVEIIVCLAPAWTPSYLSVMTGEAASMAEPDTGAGEVEGTVRDELIDPNSKSVPPVLSGSIVT